MALIFIDRKSCKKSKQRKLTVGIIVWNNHTTLNIGILINAKDFKRCEHRNMFNELDSRLHKNNLQLKLTWECAF